MKPGFRQSMAWLHTWAGLVAAWVLYFVFVTGTIGYFHIEVDRWMRPELPLAGPPRSPEVLLSAADRYLRRVAPGADYWSIQLPTGRHGSDLTITWATTTTPTAARGSQPGASSLASRTESRVFEPRTGDFVLPPVARKTGGGYRLYTMHYTLQYVPPRIGEVIVGFSAMTMLMAVISGVITHKKLFKEFFTLRLALGQRSWLDAHNVISVAVLPFVVMMTYSGLVFIMNAYMPAAVRTIYRDDSHALERDVFPRFAAAPRADRAAEMRPLALLVADARRSWGPAVPAPWLVRVTNPGDANAEVQVWHPGIGGVRQEARLRLNFSAVDGRVLGRIADTSSTPVQVESLLFGLHEGIFAGPLLRWLYFLSGAMGCLMIATGLVLWTVKRRNRHESTGAARIGYRLVEQLNIGTIAGLLVGVAAYFWANRLLPATMAARDAWEMHALFITWSVMLVYPSRRTPARAWVEELSIAAALFMLLPALNAVTTDRHLGVTVPVRDWALAGVDLTMGMFGVGLACIAIRLQRGGRVAIARVRPVAAEAS